MSTRLVAAAVLGGVLTLLYTYVVDWGGAEQLFNGLNRARALILESTGPSAAGGDGVEAEQPAYMIRGRPVERIKWEPTDAFAAHLVELGRPVVLTNTVVSTWPAVRNWREDSYLRKHAPSLPSVWNQSRALGPTFAPWRLVEEMPTRLIVEGQRSTIRMHEASFAAFARTANMHIDAAIAKRIAEEGGGADGGGAAAAAAGAEGAAAESAPRAEVKPASEYMYYTDQIAFFPRLDGDASSRELLKYRDRGIPNGTKFDAQSLIWLSHPSVTAQPHYDESHNFFAQIRSTKLIMLFSPEQAERLYYNPHLHPAQRQSQVDFDAPNLTRFPRFRHLTTLVVTLAPGELLYIPPFWGHRVESSAEDMTISVSVINPSEVEARWKRIDRKWPAEYDEAFKTPGSKIVAARILLETVLRAALGGVRSEDVAEFMAALLESRYAPMLPRLAPFMQLNSRRFKCLRSKKALYKRIEPKALVAAEPMARLFAAAIGGRAVSPAIRTILLRDFVEETLANVVEPNDVPILIANCWPPAAGGGDVPAAP